MLWGEWLILRDALLAATTPDEQIEALTNFADFQKSFATTRPTSQEVHDYYDLWETYTRTQLIDFVAAHESGRSRRVAARLRARHHAPDGRRGRSQRVLRLPSVTGRLGPAARLRGRAAADVTELRDWLDGVATTSPPAGRPRTTSPSRPSAAAPALAWSAQRAAAAATRT